MAELVKISVRQLSTQRAVAQYPDLGPGEVRCGMYTRFCGYDGLWRLWILDLAGDAIVGPLTLVPGVDLLRGHKHNPEVPQGQLFVYSADRSPPNAETVDVSASLYYRRSL